MVFQYVIILLTTIEIISSTNRNLDLDSNIRNNYNILPGICFIRTIVYIILHIIYTGLYWDTCQLKPSRRESRESRAHRYLLLLKNQSYLITTNGSRLKRLLSGLSRALPFRNGISSLKRQRPLMQAGFSRNMAANAFLKN